jgi:tetratricopeptide (TPR) repeat protein
VWAIVVTVLLTADDTLAALDRQIAQSPAAPLPRLDAAQRRIVSGEELDRALLDLDVARALLPENPRVHFLFGQLMEERGDPAQATASYQTALQLKEDYDEARFRLAGLLFQQGNFADAAAAYARYVKAHPEASGARVQLAAALEKAGDHKGAERELKAIYSDAKTRELGGRKLAELYERTGRERDATRIRAQVEPQKRRLRELLRSAR